MALVILVTAIFLLWSSSSSLPPEKSLAKARALIEEGKLDEADVFLAVAKKSPELSHWALLLQGQVALAKGSVGAAIKSFNKVPSNSAAALDARVALLRLNALSEHKAVADSRDKLPAVGEELVALERDSKSANRTDLSAEIMWIRAQLAEKRGEYQFSYNLYQELREKLKNTSLAKAARDAQHNLVEAHEDLFAAHSPAFLYTESKMLLAEGSYEEAQELIAELKNSTNESSKVYLEALLLEEKILRRDGRREEADHNLLLVSANGTRGTADGALLKIAKNAWNINEYPRALGFLAKLEERFPNSPLSFEARYVEARILEEMQSFKEAKGVYLDLLGRTKKLDDRAKVLRRLAWLYYLAGQNSEASKYFQKMHKEIAAGLAQAQLDSSTFSAFDQNLVREMHHAMYWEGATRLDKAVAQNQTALTKNSAPYEIFKQVRQAQPFGYYGMLAGRLLPGDANLKPQSPADTSHCFLNVDQKLVDRLSALHDGDLLDFAKFEIDWVLRSPQSNLPIEEELRLLNTTAKLTVRYASFKAGFGSNGKALARMLQSDFREKFQDCAAHLNELNYPRPYSELFVENAEVNGIPAELLMAVSRTESAFDPTAESHAQAKGLMQLIDSTAKAEGLAEKESLFTPETNIRLGSKHLRRLQKDFNGNLPQAIAAYNAGSNAVRRWISRNPEAEEEVWIELISYPETKDYVQKVLLAFETYKRLSASGKTADQAN